MDMDISNDWRITNQMKFLKGIRLRHTKWIQVADNWDHDHCKFCGESLDSSTGALAYCTEDFEKWICKVCFGDFREAFEWVLVEDGGDAE
jgi:hypothetical protein